MSADQVARLTRKGLEEYKAAHTLSKLVQDALDAQPRQIRSQYIFWNQDAAGKTVPVFGLDADVFDAFGMVWSELEAGYKNLIMIDEEADRRSIERHLWQ